MTKIKEFFFSVKQSFLQVVRSVTGRDIADENQTPSQKNRYYT